MSSGKKIGDFKESDGVKSTNSKNAKNAKNAKNVKNVKEDINKLQSKQTRQSRPFGDSNVKGKKPAKNTKNNTEKVIRLTLRNSPNVSASGSMVPMKEVKLVRALGKGSFATAWLCDDGSVLKIFKNSDRSVEYIYLNLVEFSRIKPMPPHTSFATNKNTGELEIYDMGSKFAYFTKFCVCDGMSLFRKPLAVVVEALTNCYGILEDYARYFEFMHGDVKMDNLLVREAGGRNGYEVLIHDWDGVYIYDRATKNHIKPGEHRQTICTPMFSHPFWAFYMQCRLTFVSDASGNRTFVKVIRDLAPYHIVFWNQFMQGGDFTNHLRWFLKQCNYYEFVKDALNESKTDDEVLAFVGKMMRRCDRYSFATSLLYAQISYVNMRKSVLDMTDKERSMLKGFVKWTKDIVESMLVPGDAPSDVDTESQSQNASRAVQNAVPTEVPTASTKRRHQNNANNANNVRSLSVPLKMLKKNSKLIGGGPPLFANDDDRMRSHVIDFVDGNIVLTPIDQPNMVGDRHNEQGDGAGGENSVGGVLAYLGL